MKTRNTLFLLLLAVGLVLFIKYYESTLPSTREANERESSVVHFDRDQINAITITNHEDKIELRKQGGIWRIDAPVKDRADSLVIDRLLTTAESLHKDGEVRFDRKGKANLKDYGVSKSNVCLKLQGPGAPPEIIFGKETALKGKVYVRLSDSNTVYAVIKDLKDQVTKKADDFRDHKLTDLSASQISRLSVKNGAGELGLQKIGSHWQLKKPIDARADDARTSDLVAQLLNARIDTFVATSDAATVGFGETRGTVELFSEEATKPALLQFGQLSGTNNDKTYARLSTRDSLYLLPAKVGEILNLKPNDLRDKHLLRLDLDVVDRINIEPAGKPKIVLARNQEDWRIKSMGDKPANNAEVRRLVKELQQRQVTAFVTDVASDLQKYGLDHPTLKLTFSSYASENTAESKSGEQSVATLLFGNTEGPDVFAKLEDEPFIVSVNKSVLDAIFSDPIRWQDLSIYKFKPADINKLEILKAGQPEIVLTRSDKTGWKPVNSEAPIDETNVKSLCNALASLRAVRWSGSNTNGFGFENPGITISFTTNGGTTGKLTVGNATKEGMWNAVAEGATGAFVISAPDVQSFQLPITGASTATPSATPLPSMSR